MSLNTVLLRDEFSDTVAAGSVNGTTATDGASTRTAVDTGNRISVSTGKLHITGASLYYDPVIHYPIIGRTSGVILIASAVKNSGREITLGYDSDNSGGTSGTLGSFAMEADSTNVYVLPENFQIASVGTLVDGSTIKFAIAMRAVGCCNFYWNGSAWL